MGSVSSFVKTVQRQRDAEEMQPWRCAACGVAVRLGRRDPCQCITRADLDAQYPDGPFAPEKP